MIPYRTVPPRSDTPAATGGDPGPRLAWMLGHSDDRGGGGRRATTRRRWRAMVVGGSVVRSVGGATGRRRWSSSGGGRRRSSSSAATRRALVRPRGRGAQRRGRASGTDALAPRHESATTARLLAAHQTSLRREACERQPRGHRHARDMPGWRAARSVEPARAGVAWRRSARPPRSHLPSRDTHEAQQRNQ